MPISSNAKKSKQVEATELEPNLDVAGKFLRSLDADAERWTFQTFDNRDHNRKLARILHGSLDEHAETLSELNCQGAAICVTMNETDFRGTSKENIRRVRALVADLDGAPLEAVRDCRLRPHIIVETSPGRYHVYWLVEEDFPLAEFEDTQRGVAKAFDGDTAVALLTHRARLPGFFHMKGDPFMSRLISVRAHHPFDTDTIQAEFPAEVKPHKASGSRPILPAGAPVPAAEEFVTRCHAIKNVLVLRSYRGAFYRWTGTHYREVPLETIGSQLYSFLNKALVSAKNGDVGPFNPTKQKVEQVVHVLRHGTGTLIEPDRDVPLWLNDPERSAKNLVACRNGILNVETRQLIEHDPAFFTTNALPLDFDASAPEPERWLKFLEEVWPEDEEAKQCLQEMFGYLLADDTRQHKIFLIWGPKRGGKGTIVDILVQLLGPENVTFQTLKSMAGEFGKWPLIHKSLCAVTDARLGSRTDTAAVAETMLSISGGDPQTINRKMQSFWNGYLKVRFLITTNDLPRISDASGTLPSRFILLRMTESFYGREDLALKEKLRAELPGILNWALAGLKRLRKRGHFNMPNSSSDALQQLEELASPVTAFLREWCVVDPAYEISVEELYAAYKVWCEMAGHKPASVHVLGKDLRQLLPKLTVTRPRNGARRRQYVGLRLSNDGQEQYDDAIRQKQRR